MRDDRVYLLHIRECIRRIRNYTPGGREDFLADTKTQDAVLRNLQTLAESSQRLSPTIKALRPEVEWRRIAAFRNVVVHDYLGVDLERTWDIVANNLQVLDAAVASLLGDAPGSD